MNGPVSVTAASDRAIYLGGQFTEIQRQVYATGPLAMLDYGTNVPVAPFLSVQGTIYAIVPDENLGWYVGGSFTSIQGQARNNLARIDYTGAVTSWNPSPDGPVFDIASYTNTLGLVYVVGSFSNVGGLPHAKAAAISSATGVPTSWAPVFDGNVTEVENGGSDVYLSGTFAQVNGLQRPHVAAFNATTGALSALFLGETSWTDVTALKFKSPNGQMFVAYASPSGYGVRGWTSPTSWYPYTVATSGPVLDIDVDFGPSLVYIGGAFGTVNGQARSCLAAFDQTTGVLNSWSPSVDGSVETVAIRGGFGLVVGGSFQTVSGRARRNLAGIDFTSGAALDWNPSPTGTVHRIGVLGTQYLMVGGEFPSFGILQRANLAAFDARTGEILDWSPKTDAKVDGLAVSGNTVYIGGAFSNVSGIARSRAAAVDATTGALKNFAPAVNTDVATTVRGFAPYEDKVYMCGSFSYVGGVPRFGIAEVDTASGSLLPWTPPGGGQMMVIRTVAPGNLSDPPMVLVGGSFSLPASPPRNFLAALDGGTGQILPWAPNASGPVWALEAIRNPSGGIERVYAGGNFGFMGGQPRPDLAEVDGAGVATAWSPNPDGPVIAMALSGSNLYVGGQFQSIGGQMRNNLASIDRTTGLATTWNPNAQLPSVVQTILKSNSTLYVGGTFQGILGTGQAYFAGIFDEMVTGVDTNPVAGARPRPVRPAPNPFEDRTVIRFELARAGAATIAIYDVAGRPVRRLHDGWLAAGTHHLPWDGTDAANRAVPSGIYFAQVTTAGGSSASKVYRLK